MKIYFYLAPSSRCEMEIDEITFRKLFDSYYDGLVLYANHVIKDPVAAEDVVQECFVDFWTKRRYEHIEEGVDKYLFQAVKHASLNYIRGCQRREQRHLQAMEEVNTEKMPELPEDELEILYAAINRLPTERKKIFTLVCLEGKKYQEVADILGISINTVKTQMGRSFQFLRSALSNNKFSILLLHVLRRSVFFSVFFVKNIDLL